MKRLFFFLIVLTIAILIGLQIKLNPGYVLISTKHIAIETRLWFALLSLIAFFLLLYYLIRIFKYTSSVPHRWRNWRHREKAQQASKHTHKGLIDLAQGDWRKAQKQLLKNIKNTPEPLLNYLGAAIAAGRDGDLAKRDAYLSDAATQLPSAKFAIGLVQAQLQYDAAQYEMALATLEQLKPQAPHHKQVLALLAKVYKKLADWSNLLEILTAAQRYDALPERQIVLMAEMAFRHRFKEMLDITELNTLWQAAPHAVRQQSDIILLYIKALNRLGAVEKADSLTRSTLKQHWFSALAGYYHHIPVENAKKQLSYAETWLKSHPKDPQALFTLAKLAERNQLWGKAKDYYLASLEIAPNPEVYAAYADLLEQQGETHESLVYYRKGLKASY